MAFANFDTVKNWIVGQTGVMRLRVSFKGPDVDRMFGRFGAALEDFTRLWLDDVAPMYFEDVQRNIATQGGLVGGWRALSPKYAAWKRKHFGHTFIMILTGDLAASLRIGGRGNVVIATRRQVLLGSTDRKLPYHQKGTARMPRRTVLLWLGDRRYGRKLAEHVKTRAIEAGFPNVRIRGGAVAARGAV